MQGEAEGVPSASACALSRCLGYQSGHLVLSAAGASPAQVWDNLGCPTVVSLRSLLSSLSVFWLPLSGGAGMYGPHKCRSGG